MTNRDEDNECAVTYFAHMLYQPNFSA